MNLEQFLQILQASTNTGEKWFIENNKIRTENFYSSKGCIYKDNICPVSHVANIIMGFSNFNSSQYSQAAKFIGLPIHIADSIIRASDKIFIPPHANNMRKSILKACNKKE